MNCPRCNNTDLWRDSADVGVGTIYGPYGCPCGWSEWESYDLTTGPQERDGYRVDQWGIATPPAADHHARLAAGTEAEALRDSDGFCNGRDCAHAAGTEE